MGWPQFLAWALAQGFKHTKFLRQAYRHFASTGKIPGKEVILKTAKNFFDKFIAKVPTKKIADKIRKDIKKTDEGKKVRKQMEKVKIEPEIRTTPRPSSEIKAVTEGMKLKKGVVNIGDRIILEMQKQGKKVTFDDILRIYGKKPPHLKAGGGRIDKALPGRSRDI